MYSRGDSNSLITFDKCRIEPICPGDSRIYVSSTLFDFHYKFTIPPYYIIYFTGKIYMYNYRFSI